MKVEPRGPDPEKIQQLFGSIATGYDKANDLMTFGMARRWRKSLVDWSEAVPGQRVLDVATGTGDLAIEFKRSLGSSSEVIGTDFCDEMLALAPQKAKEQGLDIQFKWADALTLPFSDSSFHVVSIAYGIRNVSSPLSAMREMARVCKPGGRVMILETGDSSVPLLQTGIQIYFKKIVPKIGGWVTGKPSAYEYLSQSTAKFPSQKKFLELMEKTNAFSKVECRVLFGGASFLYRGIVKE